jgi:hypothetical protein
VTWLSPDGETMQQGDWENRGIRYTTVFLAGPGCSCS